MTKKSDPLKDAARRRQDITGETYSVARAAIAQELEAQGTADLELGTPPTVPGPLFLEPVDSWG